MYKLRVGLLLACSGLPAISVSGATLYAVSFSDNDFGTLDSTTGIFSPIALGQTPSLDGMGFTSGGAMYATDTANGVYQVDPETGGLTTLSSSIAYSATGSTVGPDGLIYAVDGSTSAVFYSINPISLVVKVISAGLGFSSGSDGLAVFASGPCTGGICFYTDTYGGAGGDTLEAVDPVTGGVSAIGGFGAGINIYAGADANGTVYGVGPDSNLYTLNTTTGVATAAVTITGDNPPWFALAFETPEPSTEMLVGLGLGLAGLASAVRRWRR